MHDGAPAHFGILAQDVDIDNSQIGHAGPPIWSSLNPDMIIILITIILLILLSFLLFLD